MSELRTNRIVPRDGLTSGTGIGGGIIQVKTTEKLVHQSIQDGSGINGTPVDIMSVSISPTRSDSKILVICNVNTSCSDAALLYLFRNSTKIAAGTDGNAAARRGWAMPRTAANNQCQNNSTTILDEPATTSAVTYTIKGLNESSSNALRINRRDSGDQYGLFSNIVVMEVSG